MTFYSLDQIIRFTSAFAVGSGISYGVQYNVGMKSSWTSAIVCLALGVGSWAARSVLSERLSSQSHPHYVFYVFRRLSFFGWQEPSHALSNLARAGFALSEQHEQPVISCHECRAQVVGEVWLELVKIQENEWGRAEEILTSLHKNHCQFHWSLNSAARAAHARIYSPLDKARHVIRLLVLKPGQFQDVVKCHLRAVSLDEHPSFEALSYCWGDTLFGDTVEINGHEVIKSSTLNLILRRLRNPTSSRTLWIDALCINQLDLAERSQQVSLMQDIYSSASMCVMWLGDPIVGDRWGDLSEAISNPEENAGILWRDSADSGDEFKTFLQKSIIFSEETKDYLGVPDRNLEASHFYAAFGFFRLLSENQHLRDMAFFQVKPEGIQYADMWSDTLTAAYMILGCSWWERAWIVQEALLSPCATIYCGPFTVPFKMLERARSHIQEHLDAGCCVDVLDSLPLAHRQVLKNMWRHLDRLVTTKTRATNERGMLSLSQLVRTFRNREAKDSRDKVYALLGLVKAWKVHPGEPILEADYSLSTRDVFTQVALRIMQLDHSMDILTCQFGKKDPNHNLPSWVPDWSMSTPKFYDDLHTLYDVSSTIFKCPILTSRGLGAPNHAYDIICTVTSPFAAAGTPEKRLATLRFWMELVGLDPSARGKSAANTCKHCGGIECNTQVPGGNWEAFWMTLTGGHMGRDRGIASALDPKDLDLLSNMWEWAQSHETRFEESLIPERFRYAFDWIHQMIDEKVLFVTFNGHLGVGPAETQIGDEIRILLGASMPFVVRRPTAPVPGQVRTRRFVSPPRPVRAFKLEDGTVELSSGGAIALPSGWDQNFLPDGRVYFKTGNTESGIEALSLLDPRKDDLILTCTEKLAARQNKTREHLLAHSSSSAREWLRASLFFKPTPIAVAAGLVREMARSLSGLVDEESRLLASMPIRHVVGSCYVNGIMHGEALENFAVECEETSSGRSVYRFDHVLLV
ncbi:Fc.00g073000.m01.CDS01 [Cosmosporella sp. VM-42]